MCQVGHKAQQLHKFPPGLWSRAQQLGCSSVGRRNTWDFSSSFRAEVLKLAGTTPRVSDLGVGLRICFSNQLPGDAAAGSPGTTLRTSALENLREGGPAQPLQRAGFSGGGAAPRQSSVVKSFRPPSPPCPPPPSLLLNRLLSAGTTADTLLLLMFYNSVLSALCKAFISPSFIKTKRILVSLKTDALLVLLWVWGWL